MTLYLYFARRFVMALGLVLGVFMLFYAMVTLIDISRRFASTSAQFSDMLLLTALSLPGALYQIMPLIVILATIALFLNLARTSELVIARAAGRSALRSLAAPLVAGAAFGVIATLGGNPIVAATLDRYEALAAQFLKGGESVLSVSREGLWLRQGGEGGQTVIRATRATPDGAQIFDATFLTYDAAGMPLSRIDAESAVLVAGAWQAANARRWDLVNAANPEDQSDRLDSVAIPSELTPAQIREGFASPNSVPIWELPRYIDQLEDAGFSARRHRVFMQTELAQPLMLVAMVLIGAAFTMRHSRFGGSGLMVMAALLIGFSLYFVRNFAQVLGENGQLPVALAAWAPPIAGLLLAMGLLLHMEDG